MPSPKPLPASLRLLNGAREGRDSGGRPVQPPPAFIREAPSAPAWLSREAKAEWRRVAPGLERLDLLKPEDRGTFAAYCETWSRFVEASKRCNTDGLVASNSQGRVAAPWVGIAERAGKELRAFAAEFGLTPSAEGRLVVKGGDRGAEENPFGD